MTDPLVTQDNSVLIVSDRPQLAALLCRAVENVVTCRCIEPREALPADAPRTAVLATLFALVDTWQAARRSAVAAPARKVRDIAERARAAVSLGALVFWARTRQYLAAYEQAKIDALRKAL